MPWFQLSSCFQAVLPRLLCVESIICCTDFSHNDRFRIVICIVSLLIWCTNLKSSWWVEDANLLNQLGFTKQINFHHNKNLAFYFLHPHQHQSFDSIRRSCFSAGFWQIANFVQQFHDVHHLPFISLLFSMKLQKCLVIFVFCLLIHCSLLLHLCLFSHFLENWRFAFDSSIKISILQMLCLISSFA